MKKVRYGRPRLGSAIAPRLGFGVPFNRDQDTARVWRADTADRLFAARFDEFSFLDLLPLAVTPTATRPCRLRCDGLWPLHGRVRISLLTSPPNTSGRSLDRLRKPTSISSRRDRSPPRTDA